MHTHVPYDPYKRISVKQHHLINWRKIVFTILALFVISSMVVVEILALFPAAP